jgi:hypothetical protein
VQLSGTTFSISGTETFTPTSGPAIITPFGDFLNVTGGGASVNLAGPLLRFTDNSQITIPAGSLISLNGGASLTESGPALDSTNSHITIGGPIFAFRGGSHATLSGAPLIRLNGGSLTAGTLGSSDGAGNQINITGALLDATGATINFGNVEIPQAGPTDTDVITFSVPPGVPEYRLINSTLTDTSTDRLIDLSDGTSTYNGLLLVASGSTITLGGGLVSVESGDHVTTTSTDPLLQLSTSTVSSGDTLLSLCCGSFPSPPSLTLAGPLLSDTGSMFTIAGSLLRVRDGATLNYTSALPTPPALLQFTDSTVNMNGNLFNLGSGPGQPGGAATLAGPLLNATNSSFDSGPLSNFVSVNDGATFTSTTTDPLLTVSGGSITSNSRVFRVGLGNVYQGTATVASGSQDPVNATLAGPVLEGMDTTITSTYGVLDIRDRGTFKSATTLPLITLGGTTAANKLNLGGPDPDPTSPTYGQQVNGRVFDIQPVLNTPFSASAELWGPLLKADNTTIATTDRILSLFGLTGASATLTSHTADPLVQLTGGSVTMSGTFYPPSTSPSGTTTDTSGRFLAMSSPDPAAPATFTLAGPLLRSTGTTFEGHNHFLNFGNNSHFTSTGTDPLVQLSGATLSINGTRTFTPNSGPPIVTPFGDFLNVSGGGASANLAGPLLRATDNSQITIPAGSLISLNGGASLTESGAALDSANSHISIGGPVFAFRGGSHVTLTGGPLVRLNGGSLTAGSFGSDDGAGNQINITGALLDATGAIINFGNVEIPRPTYTDVFTIAVPAGVPEVRLINSTLTDTSTDSLTTFSDGTSTYDGLLLVASNSTITLGGHLASVREDQHVTTTTTDPLLQLTASAVTTGDNLFSVCCGSSPSPSLSVAGPLLSDSGSTFTIAGSLLRVRDGATLTYTSLLPTAPALLQFSGSTVDMNGNLFNLGSGPGQPGSTATLAGPLLSATNSTFDTGPNPNFVSVDDGGTFTSATSDPLLTLSGGSVTTKNVVRIGLGNAWSGTNQVPTGSQGRVSVTLAGPILKATDTDIAATGSVLTIRDRGTFTSTTTQPLITLGGTTSANKLTVGGPDPDPTSPTYGQQKDGQVFGVGPVLTMTPYAASAELAGPILKATDTTISTTDRIIWVYGGTGASATLTSHTTDPLVQLTGGSVTMSGTFFPPTTSPSGTTTDTSGSFLRMSSPDPANAATLTLAGPLLHASGTTFDGHNHFVRIGSNSQLISNGSDPLVELEGTEVSINGTSTFTPTGGAPTPTPFGDFFRVQDTGASLSLKGPLLVDSGSSFDMAGRFLRIQNGATFNSTTIEPLLQFDNSTVTDGSAFRILSDLGRPGSTATLAGPLVTAQNSTFNFTPDPNLLMNFVDIRGGATFTNTTPNPLIQLTDSAIHSAAIVNIGLQEDPTRSEEPVTVTLSGPVLAATDSTITAIWNLLRVGDRATFHSSSTAPLIQLGGTVGTTVTLGGIDPDPTSPTFGQPTFPSVFDVGHRRPTFSSFPTSVEIAGPILSATNSNITTPGQVIGIFGQTGASTTVTSTTPDPLVQLTGGTLTLAGTYLPYYGPGYTSTTTSGSFLAMSSPDPAAAASLTVAGKLVQANSMTISGQNHFLNVGSNVNITSTIDIPLITLNNSPLTVVQTTTFTPTGGSPTTTTNGILLNIDGSNATVNLAGSVLDAGGSDLNLAGSLVRVANGGRLTSTTTLDPLINLDGGTHTLGGGTSFAPSLLDLKGVNTDPGTGLGTDEVLRAPGAEGVIEFQRGATVNLADTAAHAIKVDTALLNASAPIVKLINSTLNTSPTGAGLMQLYQSSVTSLGPVFGLDHSILNVQSGPLLSLTGGSQMTVNGDFAYLTNGSQIWVQNGPMIFVDGTNTVNPAKPTTLNITGGLVNFGTSSGNQVIINNAIPSTGSFTSNGVTVPVSMTPGATINTGANAIKNPGTNTFSVTGVAVQGVNGAKVGINAAP